MKSYQQFFAELKRRKVFKVAAVYGAVAFGLIQVAEPLASILRLPETFLPFVVAILLLGFPVAIVLAWAFEVTPEGVQKTGAATPTEIAAIVAEPASKRWPAGLLALVGVGALIAGAWWAGRQTAPAASNADMELALSAPKETRPSLAVLPFADMSPESDQQYFSDGITEEILSTLAGIREIKVAARSSAFAFRGQSPDIRTVGDSLGVAYIIEGSVRKAGNQLRITTQLIDAADGTHLWSESYDRTMDDVFAIQTEIAQAIAGALRVPLGLEEAERLVSPTDDLEAYDLYLAGRARIKERGASLTEASRLFEAAIARDSTWAPAWAGLAEAKELTAWYPDAWGGAAPQSIVEREEHFRGYQDQAEAAARRALALDQDNASAHVALGSVHRNRLEHDLAEAEYLRALELDPDSGEILTQYAQLLMNVGRLNEEIHVSERSIELDRLAVRYLIKAAAQMVAGEYEGALATTEEGLALDPARRTNLAGWITTLSNIALGRFEALDPATFSIQSWQAPEAVSARAVHALRTRSYEEYPPELLHPVVLMAFGRPDEAARVFLRMSREDPRFAAGMHWMPVLDPIREHPAYLEAVADLNLVGVVSDRAAP
jgi:TolB-like protein